MVWLFSVLFMVAKNIHSGSGQAITHSYDRLFSSCKSPCASRQGGTVGRALDAHAGSLDSTPATQKLGVVAADFNSSIQEVGAAHQKSKVIVDHTVSLRTA